MWTKIALLSRCICVGYWIDLVGEQRPAVARAGAWRPPLWFPFLSSMEALSLWVPSMLYMYVHEGRFQLAILWGDRPVQQPTHVHRTYATSWSTRCHAASINPCIPLVPIDRLGNRLHAHARTPAGPRATSFFFNLDTFYTNHRSQLH